MSNKALVNAGGTVIYIKLSRKKSDQGGLFVGTFFTFASF